MKNQTIETGFSLIETLVAITIFIIVTAPIYFAYSQILDIIQRNQARSYAVAVIQNQIETVRNMPYAAVGIQGGYPIGQLLANQTVNYEGYSFSLQTTVKNIDDPFDGTVTSTPQDTAPADYKLVELVITCSSCPNFSPFTVTTNVAPKALETATNNGSLFINVFDAAGQPVPLTNVHVFNPSTTPPLTIDDTTNIGGLLQLVDIPTSSIAYEISVSKSGFSSETTYPLGAPGNPNPVKPHATVAQAQLTQISFVIDRTSTLNFKTADAFCRALPNVEFTQTGAKLIGTSPDIFKYQSSSATDVNGRKTVSNIEWDTYNFAVSSTAYDLSGTSPVLPIVLNPSSTSNLAWLLAPRKPRTLLVTVRDQNGNLIDDAKVELSKTGFSQVAFTKRRPLDQTDWSQSGYASQSGNIEAEATPGELKLLAINGKYPTTTIEWLISNTFDLGTTTTALYTLDWQPQSQPMETGPDSLKFQIASNNDQSSWNFLGPDNSTSTFYTATTTPVNLIHANNRYLRYKVYLKTDNENFTPLLQDFSINFSSPCIPSGQAFLNNLSAGTYTLTIQKAGFQTFSNSLSIDNDWQSYIATLEP